MSFRLAVPSFPVVRSQPHGSIGVPVCMACQGLSATCHFVNHKLVIDGDIVALYTPMALRRSTLGFRLSRAVKAEPFCPITLAFLHSLKVPVRAIGKCNFQNGRNMHDEICRL